MRIAGSSGDSSDRGFRQWSIWPSSRFPGRLLPTGFDVPHMNRDVVDLSGSLWEMVHGAEVAFPECTSLPECESTFSKASSEKVLISSSESGMNSGYGRDLCFALSESGGSLSCSRRSFVILEAPQRK